MWTIQQTGDTWELRRGDAVVASHDTYAAAVGDLAGRLAAAPGETDSPTGDGTLPERWTSTTGIAFNEAPDPSRDFTRCEWSFRDPNVYRLPLMLQTRTDMGHFGAVLAGFMDEVGVDPNPTASGGFYDNEAGVEFRNLLLSGRFGVSVDPGDVDVEWVCTAEDDDGWCLDGRHDFLAYQIIGLTGTPFPAFANATIELASGAAEPAPAEPAAVSAAAALARPLVAAAGHRFPVAPPVEWLTEPEPELGDPRLVEQPDGSLACPLYIGDDGQVYGHMARIDQCHVGYPGECVTPPLDVAGFHIGETVCAGGERIPTGALVVGSDHPARHLSAPEALDVYAHTGLAWADATVTPGQFGNWVAGAVRPDVSEVTLRVLRGSALSGDWRELMDVPGVLSLIATLTVSVPGFPIRRALAASAGFEVHEARAGVLRRHGRIVAATGLGIVAPCSSCGQTKDRPGDHGDLAAIRHTLAVLERRTRHLNAGAAAALGARIAG